MAGLQANVDMFSGNGNYKFYKVDCSDFEAMSRIFKEEKFDVVYDLAANSNIQLGAKDSRIDRKNTLDSTITLLECMVANNVKKFFFASTSAVYGSRKEDLFSENLGGLQPVSYYGGCKLASEAMISCFAHMNDLSCLVFRFPNVIGGGLTHGVIFDFVKRLRQDSTELKVLETALRQRSIFT